MDSGTPNPTTNSLEPTMDQPAKSNFGFKNTKNVYEPDLSDEALENMVPPPKRRIGEDTPLVDMSHAQEYSLANYTA